MSIRERRRTEQLNIRVTPDERDRIRAAAVQLDTTVTDLMVTATLDKIEQEERPFRGTLRKMVESGEV